MIDQTDGGGVEDAARTQNDQQGGGDGQAERDERLTQGSVEGEAQQLQGVGHDGGAEEEDAEAEWERLLPVLRAAAAEFLAARTREGARTEADLREKLSAVAGMATQVEALSLADKGAYRDKLEARLRQLMGDAGLAPDEGRLLTEVAVFADRIAIDEELARLRSHFVAFDDLCKADAPAGRRLDFLMQELNRETNTIGSKASNAEIAHLVVAMKGELEKIREQVQNVE